MRVNWEDLNRDILNCNRCPLGEGCTRKVPGQGDPHSPLMFIGEGPGEQEDRQGLAFVGPAGQLLTKMLLSVDLPRDKVYICNVVKCRPPRNRVPLPEEMEACLPFLRAQTVLIRPKVIVLLGSTAVSAVLGKEYRVTRCRGQWFERKGVWILPTYHPSALLHDETKKRDSWQDLKMLREKLKELELYEALRTGEDGKA